MEDTDFHELGRQLLTEFGSMHQRISRFADKALGGEMAVMRALMLAGGSLTPSELASEFARRERTASEHESAHDSHLAAESFVRKARNALMHAAKLS